jgi:mRNA degradation ribonuclease J1/J2
MAGVTAVFISHAHEDNALCMPVVAALSAWGIDYYFDPPSPTRTTP